MKYFLFILILLWGANDLAAKELKYPVAAIPEHLREHTDAVVREFSRTVEVSGTGSQTVHEKFVITIFNKSAERLGYFREYYDNIRKIDSYTVNGYNSFGVLTKKVKKSDFTDIKAYDGFSLYDDNRVIYYHPMSTVYPYTIEIETRVTDKQTMNFDSWIPIPAYDVAVEHAELIVHCSKPGSMRFFVSGMPHEEDRTFTNADEIEKWELTNLTAIENESYMPDLMGYEPRVYMAPVGFVYDGFGGNMQTWENYGKWSWQLIQDRIELPEEAQVRIKELVQDAPNDEEKVKRLYQYLQDNTRYVSIQLGIGGYQPFEASFVDANNYGDCKALSNYMRALLQVVDVPSNYIEIKAGKGRYNFNQEFPSNQSNHVILCVPNKGDSIWLECTSQRQPFGFLGSFTDNRYGMEITENGGKLVKTPTYGLEENTQYRTVRAKVDASGGLQLSSTTRYRGLQYESVDDLLYSSPEEQKESIYKKLNIPGSKLKAYQLESTGDYIPVAKLSLDLSIDKYAQCSGDRLFVPLNPLNQQSFIPKKLKERKYPIRTNRDMHDVDTVYLSLPEGYKVEYLPEGKHIETPYGIYETQISADAEKITLIRDKKYLKGEFKAEEYEAFRAYFKAVAQADQDKVVLLKE